MKQKLLTLSILIFFGMVSLQAQNENPLAYSYWRVGTERGPASFVHYFTQDTILQGDFLEDTLIVKTKYTINNDTIVFVAINNFFCDTIMKGQYLIERQDSIMRFTLINDECDLRGEESPFIVYTLIKYAPPINLDEVGGIEDMPETEFSFYPNPATDGRFFYENTSNERPKYFLYNRYGKLIKNGNILTEGEILLFKNDPGIYFMTIQKEDGSIETFKLILN